MGRLSHWRNSLPTASASWLSSQNSRQELCRDWGCVPARVRRVARVSMGLCLAIEHSLGVGVAPSAERMSRRANSKKNRANVAS
jgi:hypothetical protein